ncbi:hypothetical protein [uncultured Stenotrophomonas sp.]|uniref:hypothetical protein n=1 Tax=uncultured Stenotrophomonas sp. TaxID=165438 RepID=UPI00258902BB|nr:hypothetical protein [uncultured Stenotrophomonas sp.]
MATKPFIAGWAQIVIGACGNGPWWANAVIGAFGILIVLSTYGDEEVPDGRGAPEEIKNTRAEVKND